MQQEGHLQGEMCVRQNGKVSVVTTGRGLKRAGVRQHALGVSNETGTREHKKSNGSAGFGWEFCTPERNSTQHSTHCVAPCNKDRHKTYMCDSQWVVPRLSSTLGTPWGIPRVLGYGTGGWVPLGAAVTWS